MDVKARSEEPISTVAGKVSMELFSASKQWATRPADERFASIQELHDATKAYYQTAGQKTVEVAKLRTEAIDGDVQLVGREGVAAKFTHWSFGQLRSEE